MVRHEQPAGVPVMPGLDERMQLRYCCGPPPHGAQGINELLMVMDPLLDDELRGPGVYALERRAGSAGLRKGLQREGGEPNRHDRPTQRIRGAPDGSSLERA